MAQSCECPKCGTDISESYEPEDHSVGVMAGWYCDACDLAVGDDGIYEPMEGDVPIMTAKEFRPLGTPLSELSGQPGKPGLCGVRSHRQDLGVRLTRKGARP